MTRFGHEIERLPKIKEEYVDIKDMKRSIQVGAIVVGLLLCRSASVAADEHTAAPRTMAALPSSAVETTTPGERLTQRGEPNRRRRDGGWLGRWWRGSTQSQKNNAEVKSVYKPSAESVAKSMGRIFADGKAVALATVVDADGYLVTKASLLEEDKKLTCQLPGSEPVGVALVGVDEDYDLALLKVDGQKLTPVNWREEVAGPGTFVAAVDQDGGVISIGVISTEPRRVRATRSPNPRRAWLGVSLGGGDRGTVITQVIDASAAQRAGLQPADRIDRIDSAEMKSMEQVIATIGKHSPRDKVAIMIQRADELLEFNVTLGKPPADSAPQDHWGGGPFSVRRGGFPEVLTHDTIIRPAQCGGPLIDTDGKVVGINIARALRVSSYAVPAETVQRLVKQLKKS